MNSFRSLRQQVVRGLLACIVLIWPLTGITVPFSLFALVAGAVLAYEGITRSVIRWTLALFIIGELFYGVGPGVLSLPFMAGVLLLAAVRRWTSIVPFVHEPGWPLIALCRAALVGWVIAIAVGAAQALMQSVVYGGGMFRDRLFMQMGSSTRIGAAYGVMVLLLIILHRVDIPFRRPVIYGS